MSSNQPRPTKVKKPTEFFVSFDNRNAAGYVRGVKVTLEEDILDSTDSVRIDLADHPLYHHLQAYVKANPR